jgi:hypothetical protein
MTRDEVVRVVSRALACIQMVSAVLDASYLPNYSLSLHHYSQSAELSTSSAYLATYDRLDIAFMSGRVGFLCLMALIFWNCGPRIACFLLPEVQSESPAA